MATTKKDSETLDVGEAWDIEVILGHYLIDWLKAPRKSMVRRLAHAVVVDSSLKVVANDFFEWIVRKKWQDPNQI